MRSAAFQLASVLLLASSFGAKAQVEATIPSSPPSPPGLHWYQSVANGVTMTNLTPVAYFRGLLGMTPAERERVLAQKSPSERSQVLAKVREYEQLPPDVREARLVQTELHWYLLVLLRMDPAQREQRLKGISPIYLPMLGPQLAQWDDLPAEVRQALLEKESFLRTYVQWQGHSPSAQENMLAKLPAGQRERWAQELNHWQSLPDSRREELSQAFRRFFYSTGDEQKETIQGLSEAERRQMEQALQSYANLPPAQQRQCLESFGKFAEMSADERSQFLENAAKWETMTAHERQLWRTLVNQLPPMPPSFCRPSLPPMPPGWPLPPRPPLTGGNGETNLAKVGK